MICKITIMLNLIFLYSIPMVATGHSDWSPDITTKYYHWNAVKSELRSLKTAEQYHDIYLIGGINLQGGGTAIYLQIEPPMSFNFFNGSRLTIHINVEGDISIVPLNYNSDYPLLLLPISMNNVSFFQQLFNDTELIENLTKATYTSSSITDTTAIVNVKYNEILDVQYKWKTSTGILVRKEVTAPSGKKLVVTTGRGLIAPGWTFSIELITILVILGSRSRIKRNSSR